MNKLSLLLLLLILILGAFLRFYLIQEYPLGLYPDEAMNGNNALEAIHNTNFSAKGGPAFGWKVFYPENNGREGLFINIQAFSLWIFGNESWALRLVSAILGTLTIFGVFLLTIELFHNNQPQIQNSKFKIQNYNAKLKIWPISWATKIFNFSFLTFNLEKNEIIALLTSFFLTTSYWHLNFSRIGFRAIAVPFFATFGLYFLLKGLRQKSISNLVWAGIFIGLGFHTYIAFRFMPFILAIPIIWYLGQWWKERRTPRSPTYRGESDFPTVSCVPCAIILFLFVTFLVALPIGYYFLQNPGDFLGRSGQVSIFSAESPLKEFLKSNGLTLQMFFWQGDCNWRHNFNCQPELHPLIAVFFAIGFIVAVGNILRSTRNFQFFPRSAVADRDLPRPLLAAGMAAEGLATGLKGLGTIFNFQSNSNDLIFKRFRIWNLFRNSDLEIRNSKTGFIYTLLIIWLLIMMLPATLTREGLPHALRSIGLIPPVMILAALGAYWILEKILAWLEKQKEKWPNYTGRLQRIKREFSWLFVLVLLLPVPGVYGDYFNRWAQNPNTFYAFSTDLLHLGQFLEKLPPDIKKYVVVNMAGVDIRGLPAPAQTIMFATDTFREEARRQKNIIYLTPENWEKILRIQPAEKILTAFLDGTDRQLIYQIQKKYPELKVKVPEDFVVLQNY